MITLLLMLAACGTETVETTSTTDNTATEQTEEVVTPNTTKVTETPAKNGDTTVEIKTVENKQETVQTENTNKTEGDNNATDD